MRPLARLGRVHQHDRAADLRHHLQRAIIPQQGRDVVNDRRPRRQRGLHHRGLARVDRDERAAAREPFDHGDDAANLVAFPHGGGTRPRRFAADIDQRCTGRRQHHAGTGGRSRIVVQRAAVGEAVGRDVEDARDARLVEAQRALAQHQRCARRGDRGVELGRALVREQRVEIGDRDGAAAIVLDHFIGGEPEHPAGEPRNLSVAPDGGVDELDRAEVERGHRSFLYRSPAEAGAQSRNANRVAPRRITATLATGPRHAPGNRSV